jgi:hypothetical protein
MTGSVKRIEGSLLEKDGSVLRVDLRATIVELRGQHGVEDETVARVDLDSQAPDGEYWLEYFYRKSYAARVRVKDGVLLAA